MRIVLLSTALLFTLGKTSFSQNLNKAKLDNYFNALQQNDKFMGSVAVAKDGNIIYTKSIGFADIENKVNANENSKYRIGSISKTFTAVLVLKAAEAKKINLSQTIDKWFPQINNANQITVKHLLGHRSGIHNFTDNQDFLTWNTTPKSEKEMLAIISKSVSDFKPDSKAQYSNSNYVLLSYILEKTFNISYSKLLIENIVDPLGLTNTYVFGKTNTSKNECKSYTFFGNWNVESETDFSVPLGAGAIVSTPTDITKFADALFGGKLLTSASLEMMKIIKEDYGLGLFQVPFNESIGYGHNGSIDGFTSVFYYFPEEKISYALLSNGSNFNNNDISIAVLSAAFGAPYDIPTFSTIKLSLEELDKYLGVYASKQIPLKITISKNGNTLIAQGTGQPAFPLEATGKHKFKFDQAGAKFEFNPTAKTMILLQGGANIEFTKE